MVCCFAGGSWDRGDIRKLQLGLLHAELFSFLQTAVKESMCLPSRRSRCGSCEVSLVENASTTLVYAVSSNISINCAAC